ncbi:hypothetical protein [Legionella birminghamensis]|uniref:hypothetical protein n=1 Tax=Legionella birminghamensis TaxID=28083 RepID=UPI0010416386|nr:hypothetical protein [Legionella birminghamensis]
MFLFHLGTDTFDTPLPEQDPKNYPFGETLSSGARTIDSDGVRRDEETPYFSDKVEVIIGPDTLGKAVYSRIARGMEAMLRAISLGENSIGIVAHSRGGVATILETHYMNAIKNKFNECKAKGDVSFDQFLGLLKADPVVGPFLKNAVIAAKLKQEVVPQLKAVWESRSTIETRLNIFVLDPVPGDVPLYGWDDALFYQPLPEIVNHAEIIYYDDERSWGFTPIVPKAPTHEDAKFSAITIPGHHGTASSGNNCDQTGAPVPNIRVKSSEKIANTKQAQKLLFLKILRFLNTNQASFDLRTFEKPTPKGLLERVIKSLASNKFIDGQNPLARKKNDSETYEAEINSEALVSACFRSYWKIMDNIDAYRHFGNTNYAYLGKRNKLFREALHEGKYVPLSSVIPPVSGFVNEEHAKMAREKLFKDFGIDASSSIDKLLAQATDALVSGFLAAISKPGDAPKEDFDLSVSSSMSSSWTILNPSRAAITSSTVANLLATDSGKKMIKEGFAAVVEKISQSYLSADLTPETRWTLYQAIVSAFGQFEETLQTLKQTEEARQAGESAPVGVGAVITAIARLASNPEQIRNNELINLLQEVKADAQSSLIKTFTQYQDNLERELEHFIAVLDTPNHVKLSNGFKTVCFSMVKKNSDAENADTEQDKRFLDILQKRINEVSDSNYPENIDLLWPLIKSDIIEIYGLSREDSEALDKIDSLLRKYFYPEPGWSDFEVLFDKLINFQRDLKAVNITPTDEYLKKLQINLYQLSDYAARYLPEQGDKNSQFALHVKCFRIMLAKDMLSSLEEFKSKMESLQNDLSASIEAEGTLSSEKEVLKETVSQLEQEIASYRKKVEALTSEKESLTEDKEELITTLKKLRGVRELLDRLQEKHTILIRESEQLKLEKNDVIQQQLELLTDLEKKNRLLAGTEKANTELQAKTEAQQKQLTDAEETKQTLEVSIQRLASEKEAVEKERQQLSEQRQELQKQNTELQAKTEAQQKQLVDAEKTKQTLEVSNQRLASEKEAVEKERQQLSEQRQELQKQNAELQAKTEAQQKQLVDAEKTKQTLEVSIQRLASEKEAVDEERRELNRRKDEVEKHNSQLRIEAEVRKGSLEEAESAKEALSKENEILKSENSGLKQESAELVQKNEVLKQEKLLLAAEVVKLDAELEQSNRNGQAQEREISGLKQDKERLERELRELRDRKRTQSEEERIRLIKDLNSETQRKCLNAITDEILPSIDNYIKHLEKQTDAVAHQKLEIVTRLKATLTDEEKHPLAFDRIQEFKKELTEADKKIIGSHRDSAWKRFTLNTLAIISICLTGVIPGMAILGAYSYASGRSPMFWRSRGVDTIKEVENSLGKIETPGRVQ